MELFEINNILEPHPDHQTEEKRLEKKKQKDFGTPFQKDCHPQIFVIFASDKGTLSKPQEQKSKPNLQNASSPNGASQGNKT